MEGAKDHSSPVGESRNPDSGLKVEEGMKVAGEPSSSSQHLVPINIENAPAIWEGDQSCTANTQVRTDNGVVDTESDSLNVSFSLRNQANQAEPSQMTEMKQETNCPTDGGLTEKPAQGNSRVSKKSAKSRKQRKSIPQSKLMFTDE